MANIDEYPVVPPSNRVMIDPDPLLVKVMRKARITNAEYRGTDPLSGNEYWFLPDPPVAFVVVKEERRVVVYHLGSDPEAS